MVRLRSKLLSLNNDKAPRDRVKVFSPANCEELRISFKTDKIAKVVGRLAQIPPSLSHRSSEDEDNKDPQPPQLITGVLVQNDFKMSLMAPKDLHEYAGLATTTITCKQRLTLSAAAVDLIRWALEGTFGSLKKISRKENAINGKSEVNGNGVHKSEDADEEVDRSTTSFLVMDCVIVTCRNYGEVEVEWEGNMINDGIADAVLAVLFTVESSPAAVRRTYPLSPSLCPVESWQLTFHPESSSKHAHSHTDKELSKPKHNPHSYLSPGTRLSRLFMFLESQFGPAIAPIARPRLPNPAIASSNEDEDLSPLESAELKRLHSLGIPVPGVEIRVDKHVAKVWLETLEVECANTVLRDRVRAVVERAVETVAPLWGD